MKIEKILLQNFYSNISLSLMGKRVAKSLSSEEELANIMIFQTEKFKVEKETWVLNVKSVSMELSYTTFPALQIQ